MKMSELIRYDLPAEVIRMWQERESDILLAVQELAVKRFELFEGGNLLIQAPTSSGKTFVGEMAAVQTALRRKKVVYLVSLKALAEEKYRDFKEKYEAYGLRVIISSRDHREFDRDLEEGNFSIAIVVYEKLSHLLVRRPEHLQEIELVVADELELLSDPERGAGVEILLTRMLGGACRLIGLSAVIGHADRLAEWMNAKLVLYEQRPVELRYGVLHEGRFRYRTHNAYGEGVETLSDSDESSNWAVLSANVCSLAAKGESSLVFVKSKYEALRGAEQLAADMETPAAPTAIETLRTMEPTRARASLLNTLNSGVAFHSADLLPDERVLVERGFRTGEIKVIVCTSTLAVGLNLPARNVFITADKWRYDRRFGMPWKAPILRAEYENMGGRAGRYGLGQEFGRSIMIAATPFDVETLWRRYIEGDREGIQPRLDNDALEDHVLRLVASRVCRTDAEALDFLESTLTGRWIWREQYPLEEIERRINEAIYRAMDFGVLTRDTRNHLEATPFGQAVASKGIQIQTARELESWIGETETRQWSDLDLLFAAAATPDGRMYNVTLTAQEYESARYLSMLRSAACAWNDTADTPLNRVMNASGTPFFEDVRAIKVALLLERWTEQESVSDIEETFHTMAGQILAAADQISWVIDAAAAIAASLGATPVFVERIRSLSERVQHGMCESGLPLARLRELSLERSAVTALVVHGRHTPEALADTPPGVLEQWMSRKQAHALKAWGATQSEAVADAAGERPAPVPVLRVDEREPDMIYLEGVPVPLQEKQFRLIQVLAESPGRCVSYERIYEAVWGDAVVENNQMHFQKRKLLERIGQANPGYRQIVRTVPKRGFVLNLSPEQVVVESAVVV